MLTNNGPTSKSSIIKDTRDNVPVTKCVFLTEKLYDCVIFDILKTKMKTLVV